MNSFSNMTRQKRTNSKEILLLVITFHGNMGLFGFHFLGLSCVIRFWIKSPNIKVKWFLVQNLWRKMW